MGWPPIVSEQSSKSSAWEAVPLISAASSAATRRSEPNTSAGPGAALTLSVICVQGSGKPASVTPTKSSTPTFAQWIASAGRSA